MATHTPPAWKVHLWDDQHRNEFIDTHPNTSRHERITRELQQVYNANLERASLTRYQPTKAFATDYDQFSSQTVTHVNGVNIRLAEDDFKLLLSDIQLGQDAIRDQSRFFAEQYKLHQEKELRRAHPGLDQAYQAYLVLLELYKEHGK